MSARQCDEARAFRRAAGLPTPCTCCCGPTGLRASRV